jgi:hypothetical protein
MQSIRTNLNQYKLIRISFLPHMYLSLDRRRPGSITPPPLPASSYHSTTPACRSGSPPMAPPSLRHPTTQRDARTIPDPAPLDPDSPASDYPCAAASFPTVQRRCRSPLHDASASPRSPLHPTDPAASCSSPASVRSGGRLPLPYTPTWCFV